MHTGRQPKEQHPGMKPSTEHCSWGAAACTPRHPDRGLLRRGACPTNVKGDSELEGSFCPPSNPTSSLVFPTTATLGHALSCSVWALLPGDPLKGGRKGLESPPWSAGTASLQDLSLAIVGSWDARESRAGAMLSPRAWSQ